jgi:hypothetical protein
MPDAPDSVLRIGCRADGETWRCVRSHLRGLLDELQIYDEALVLGWRLRFRVEAAELELASGKAAVIDNPALSYSGRHRLRIEPHQRKIQLQYPELAARRFSAGFYEVSVCVVTSSARCSNGRRHGYGRSECGRTLWRTI